MGTPLTEATYRVVVQRRSGEFDLPGCEFRFGEGSFNRVLNGISQSDFVGLPGDCDCSCIPEDGSYELAWYRSDCPDTPAWVGPITRVTDDPETGLVSISAVDRLHWIEGSELPRDVLYLGPNEVDINALFLELFEASAQFEDPSLNPFYEGITGNTPPPSGLTVESTSAIEGSSAWAAMLGLVGGAFEFTVVGDELYYGAPIPLSDGPDIRAEDGHWVTPPTIDRVLTVFSRVNITAANGIVVNYPVEGHVVPQGAGGKRTLFISDTTLNTEQEALDRARELYEANSRPQSFVVTGGSTLSPSFPDGLKQLVPSRTYNVKASGLCLEAEERLQMFNVVVVAASEGASSSGIKEQRVAADWRSPNSAGSAERQSA